jgi:hypothetical protein
MQWLTRSTSRRRFAPVALVTVVALAIVGSAPVGAQSYRTALGVTGAWSGAGDLTPGLELESVLEDSWVAGAQYEIWPGSRRAGIRLSTSFAAREMAAGSGSFLVVAADLGLMVRPLPAHRDRVIAPFLAVGAGPVVYIADADGPPLGAGAYGDDPVVRLAVVPSIGVDLFTAFRVGLRLELGDQIVFPSVGQSPEIEGGVPRVHNPMARAAAQIRFGRAAPRPTVARAPPAAATSDDAGALYTVRVATLPGRTMAERWAERLEEIPLHVWFTDGRELGRRVTHVQLGLVDSPDSAELLAIRLRRDFGYETRIEELPAWQDVPADAIVVTLRYIHGG